MARLHLCIFLFGFLSTVASKCRAGTDAVSAFKEEDVALSCLNFNITDSATCFRIRLTKCINDSHSSVIFEYPKKSQDAKRVKLEANRKGQQCVFLKTLQKSDEGKYGFEIWKGWDQINVTHITLKVKDCKTLKGAMAKPGNSVKLNCSVDAETAPSNITWANQKGGITVPVNLTRAEMKGVLLTIPSALASDSGWYRCDYVLGQSQRCSLINLHVEGHQEHVVTTTLVPSPGFTGTIQAFSQVLQTTGKQGSETLILVGVLVTTFIITLAALTVVIIYKRCKTKKGSTVCFREHGEFYENVSLPCSDATDRINSLYIFPEEAGVLGNTFQI